VNLEETLLTSYLENAEATHEESADLAAEGSIAVSMIHSQKKTSIHQIRVEDTASNDANLPTVGRNDPCPCGSEKKYKLCH
jgi:uncharacterized protein YecA (UPF0149 family)